MYTHIHEYYPDIKKNEIKPFATIRINPEIIILSEGSQTKTYHLISLRYGI